MSFLTGKTTHELAEELGGRIYLNPQKYYGNPDEGWELAEEYLSGHVRDKLLYARQRATEEPELFARKWRRWKRYSRHLLPLPILR